MNPMNAVTDAVPLRTEQRQKEVIDATRDPQSTLSPNSVEKTLVEETKKAGGAAYQFDPASTREQKDEQVKSVTEIPVKRYNYHRLVVADCSFADHTA